MTNYMVITKNYHVQRKYMGSRYGGAWYFSAATSRLKINIETDLISQHWPGLSIGLIYRCD